MKGLIKPKQRSDQIRPLYVLRKLSLCNKATCNLCFVVKDYLENNLAQLTTVELVMLEVIEKIDFKQKDP